MPLVPLYNFDHGRKTPVDLSLGRIRISISDKHCENLGFLARHSKRTFTLDDKSNRIVIEHDKKHGQVVETAELEIIDPNFTSSELFPELPDSDPAFDIALMLSFFSGRRVFTENFPEECRNTRYSSTSFEIKKVLRTSRIWERLTEIQNHNLSKAVYCIVKSYNSCDLTGMAMYICTALEICVTSSCKTQKVTKYTDVKIIKTLRDKAIERTKRSIHYKVTSTFIALLKSKDINSEIVQDIEARINSSLSPSAFFKLRAFLRSMDVFPEDESDESEKRLKLLNQLRNSIAHSGDIPVVKNMTLNDRERISGAIVLLMQEIVQLYIAVNLLGIDSPKLQRCRKNIQIFFERGTFRGQEVFNEEYEDYILRISNQWIQQGKM